jgi:HK97 gp10 family phage protein
LKNAGIAKWYGKHVFTLATAANVAAMRRAALVVERDVQQNFTLQGSGREYKRGKKVHRASVKGEPPAIDTGVLRASIMSEVKTKGLGVIGMVGPDVEHIASKAEVGTDVNYGLYLELGTSRMQPRPFLRPALSRKKREVKNIFKKANS